MVRMRRLPTRCRAKSGSTCIRPIVDGLATLEAAPPVYGGGTPDIAVITAVVARDYLDLRFKDEPWVAIMPRLDALVAATAERPAFRDTKPYL